MRGFEGPVVFSDVRLAGRFSGRRGQRIAVRNATARVLARDGQEFTFYGGHLTVELVLSGGSFYGIAGASGGDFYAVELRDDENDENN